MVKSIVKNTSKYLEIYDETKESTTKLENYSIPSLLNKNIDSVTSDLTSKGLNYVILGNGDKVVGQYPNIGEKINKLDKVFLLTNSNEIKMPDLAGYSLKDFLSFISLVNIPYKIEGSGYITSQSILKDTVITSDLTLEVKLESKY